MAASQSLVFCWERGEKRRERIGSLNSKGEGFCCCGSGGGARATGIEEAVFRGIECEGYVRGVEFPSGDVVVGYCDILFCLDRRKVLTFNK